MKRAARGALAVALIGGAMTVAVMPVSAKPADTQCSGTLAAGTYDNVTVAAGASCVLPSGVTVTHDVKVQRGGKLTDRGATINHDIHADNPAGIGIMGNVGHDIHITRVSGSGPGAGGDSYICSATVGHNLMVNGGASSASLVNIGDAPDCTPNSVHVDHDLNVSGNANALDMTGITVGHNLQVHGNSKSVTVKNNHVGHDANCTHNTSFTGSANIAGGHHNTCNA